MDPDSKPAPAAPDDPTAATPDAAVPPPASNPEPAAAATGQNPHLESAIVDAIKTVFDPEIPVNIHEIGLIYNVDVQPDGRVEIKMTLTSPGCPAAQEIPAEVKSRVEGVAGVTSCDVEIVWDPAWNPSMMSEAARLQLGFF